MPPHIAGATLTAARWTELSGWSADDHAKALAVFAGGASPPHPKATIRLAQPQDERLRRLIDAAQALGKGVDLSAARHFFETHFDPWRITPHQGGGFLTAYFEPEFAASRRRSAGHSAALLARPADLVTFVQGAAPAPLDPTFAAGRAVAGAIEPFPTRAEIEDGALEGQGLERAWLDPVDLFFMQVQGSGRLIHGDGTRERFAYAGRNGRPYTSIGKVIVAEGHMTLEGMTLEKLMGWLKSHPDEARRILRLNESYVFFERIDGLEPEAGPIGGAGLSLTPHRSIAVDRSIWSYGLPFWLETELPMTLQSAERVARLMIAQDTGSAILGAARADYFMGTGAEAGRRAGLVRQSASFTVLLPKDGP